MENQNAFHEMINFALFLPPSSRMISEDNSSERKSWWASPGRQWVCEAVCVVSVHVCAHMCCVMGSWQRRAWGPKWTPPPPSSDALSLLGGRNQRGGLVRPVTVLQAPDGHLTVFYSRALGESSKYEEGEGLFFFRPMAC